MAGRFDIQSVFIENAILKWILQSAKFVIPITTKVHFQFQ